MSPKVSVIIPTYNRADLLPRAIDSVLNQTFQDFELIIVDDGSTDNTKEIIKSFNEPRIIYLWQKNKGPAGARNTGIGKARGKYIAFLDSDDLWLPEKLEKQIEFLEKNPEIGLLGTGCYEINRQGEVIDKKIFPAENRILQKILIRYNPFIQSSIIIKKEIFNQVSGYDESFSQSEDYELWLRIANHYEIANLSLPLVMKRCYQENLSPNKDREQLLFAFKAKKKAIKSGQYSKWSYIYLFGHYFFLKMPYSLRRFIRKYIFGKKVYA